MRKRVTSFLPPLVALVMVLLATWGVASGSPDVPPGDLPVSIASSVQQAGAQGTLGGDVLLSAFEGYDYYVTVAYNSNAQEFLVVWNHLGDLYGQLYDGQGVPRGENMLIDDSGFAARPRAAYSLAFDRYLVVSEHWNGTSQVFGQFVDADGSRLGGSFILDDQVDHQIQPDVASDGTDFFVVWQGDMGGGALDSIYGRGVNGDGSFSTVMLTVATGGGVTRENPAVAFNETAVEYLVVFRQGGGSTTEIHARRVAQDGSFPGNEYLVADQPYAYYPSLAAAPWGVTGGYVVVWSDSRDGSADIYGRVVLAGSDLSFDGGDFVICNSTIGQRSAPVIARSPASGQFLVVWNDSRNDAVSELDVYAQRLTDDANLVGGNLIVSAAYGVQWFPAVAASQSPDVYMIVWEDNRDNMLNIYGQRVAGNGSLLWYEFIVSAQPEGQSAPAVAFNSAYNGGEGQYLAVWQSEQDGHWAIYGQRLSADGQPLEEPWAIENDGHDNVEPTVAYSGYFQRYLVLWADTDLDRIEGRSVPATGGAYLNVPMADSAGGRRPRLAYDAANRRFLAVWEANGNIYAHALTADGLPLPGDSTEVVSVGGTQARPAVAFDSTRQRFLAVWQDDAFGPERIYGRFIDSLGANDGFHFVIAGDADNRPRRRPAVTYNPDADEYLVVYEYQVGSKESDIYGRRVRGSGGFPDAELIVRDQPLLADQFAPDVMYVPAAGQYYVIWSEYQDSYWDCDLYGLWLDAAGAPASALLPFFSYPEDQLYPRLAHDPNHERGLVVWEDRRRGQGGDVYARLGALDLEPPTALFTRDPIVGLAGTTFVFDARPSHDNLTPDGALRVRWDWTSDGSWDTPLGYNRVVSRTVPAPGIYTVTLEVWDMMWLTDTISLPIYVLPASGNTPPVAAMSVSPLVGVAGQTFQLDASASTDAETPANLQFRWDWENDGVFDTLWSGVQIRNPSFDDAGLHLARVEVRDAGGLTDAAVRAFLVLPGDVVTLTVRPTAATVQAGETIRFRATAWDSYGNWMRNPSVTWSLTDARVGVIDASGVFTASIWPGAYADVVQAEVNGVSDTATVTIIYAHNVYLPLVLR